MNPLLCPLSLTNSRANGKVNGSSTQVKGGQFLTNFDNSNQTYVYYVSFIPESFYVQDDDVASWIDSEATNHVCKDKRMFETLTPLEDGSVLKMGDDSFIPICGLGVVCLEFTSGKTIRLFDVLSVPKIRKNLVSSSCLFLMVLNKLLSRISLFCLRVECLLALDI